MRDNKKGYTLVEIIVCFALIGIFMSATAVVLSTFFEVSAKMNSINQAQTLSVTLMDTIAGELTSAAASKEDSTEGEIENTYIQITHDGTSISYMDKNGYPVSMGVDNEQKLLLEYTDKDSEDKTSFWGLGEGVYMDNLIDSLTFKKIDPDKNLIQINLKLINNRTGYVAEKEALVQCFNVNATNIQ